jgi:transcriptional regulator with XRE-family HTH domain
MSFRENLKSELDYTGMLVKELATSTGVPKKTIDKYLLTDRCCMPPADKAVAIAQALGVSVEYLVSGKKQRNEHAFKECLSPEIRTVVDIVEPLCWEERKLVVEVVAELVSLLQREKEEKRVITELTPLQKIFLQLFR